MKPALTNYSMIVRIDGKLACHARNEIKIMLVETLGGDKARHITITHEGIIIDLIDNGEIIDTKAMEHHEMLDWEI